MQENKSFQTADQEAIFCETEADAWFDRNAKGGISPAPADHPVLQAAIASSLPPTGRLIDLGGGVGSVAAGLLRVLKGWSAVVLEPSGKAVLAGKERFPEVTFVQASLSRVNEILDEQFDLVVVAGVLTWIDRKWLSQAVANIDRMVVHNGTLIISDFETPYPRANNYKHHDGLFTYKQDYSAPFLSLNLYTQTYRRAATLTDMTVADKSDPYDRSWMTACLQKDLSGRYRR
jgi:ubiquinone/menaquinone biosynthesis C-methylase UbiE